MGYAVMRRDWFSIEKKCLTELTQAWKIQAMRKYYVQWQALKSQYFPMFIHWKRDAKNKPHLGIKVLNSEHETYAKYQNF